MTDFFLPLSAGIEFYTEGTLGALDVEEVLRYVSEKTGIPCHFRGNVYKGRPEKTLVSVAKEFATIRVKDPERSWAPREALEGEIDYEKRRVASLAWRTFGILYEGILYQKTILDLIAKGEKDSDHCTILITNQLFGTWDSRDGRYHVRTSLHGFPHLISITGLVEAPAKPKEFYIKKQMGLPVESLKEEYRGRFLHHGDPRMTGVLKGYVMQAIFFHLSGDPFCQDPDCRLFNSHWQEEVLHSQTDGQYEFCPRHEAILKGLRDRTRKGAIN